MVSRTAPILLALVCTGLLAACSDDHAPAHQRADLTGTVTDAAGQPVADAAIGLVYTIDGYQLPGDDPSKPRTSLQFIVPEPAFVEVWISDRARTTVRHLLSDTLQVGTHNIIWDGKDDAGDRVPTGTYVVYRSVDGVTADSGQLFSYEHDPWALRDMPNAVTDANGFYRVPGELVAAGDSLTVSTAPEPDGFTRAAIAPLIHVVAVVSLDDTTLVHARSDVVYDPDGAAVRRDLVLPPAP